MQVRAARFR